jgi:hypothetical protein
MYKVNVEQTSAPEDNFSPKLKMTITHDIFKDKPILEATLNVETLQDVSALTNERFETLDAFIELFKSIDGKFTDTE